VIRLITDVNTHESCRKKFKENRILMVASLYVSEVLCFTKMYKGNLKQNLVIHDHNMRRKYDLHTHFGNTALVEKSVLNMGTKLYKNLPLKIKKFEKSSFE
jgi:hypothetical protein